MGTHLQGLQRRIELCTACWRRDRHFQAYTVAFRQGHNTADAHFEHQVQTNCGAHWRKHEGKLCHLSVILMMMGGCRVFHSHVSHPHECAHPVYGASQISTANSKFMAVSWEAGVSHTEQVQRLFKVGARMIHEVCKVTFSPLTAELSGLAHARLRIGLHVGHVYVRRSASGIKSDFSFTGKLPNPFAQLYGLPWNLLQTVCSSQFDSCCQVDG